MEGDSAMPTADALHLAGRCGITKHLDLSVFAFEQACLSAAKDPESFTISDERPAFSESSAGHISTWVDLE